MNRDSFGVQTLFQKFAKEQVLNSGGPGLPDLASESPLTMRIASGDTEIWASFDPKIHPVKASVVRDSVEDWAAKEGASLMNKDDFEILVWPEPRDGRATGYPLMVRRDRPAHLPRLICTDQEGDQSIESRFASLISIKYRGIDFEDKTEGLVNRLSTLGPSELRRRHRCSASFGVSLQNRKMRQLLERSGVRTFTLSALGKWPPPAECCFVDGDRGIIEVDAGSHREMGKILSKVFEVLVANDCAHRVAPKIRVGALHSRPLHQLAKSFVCASLPIQMVKDKLQKLGYVTTLSVYPDGEIFLRSYKPNLAAVKLDFVPAIDCYLSYYPQNGESHLTISSTNRSQALRSQEELNGILGDISVAFPTSEDLPGTTDKLPTQPFLMLPWRIRYMFGLNVRPRLDIVEEVARNAHWNVSLVSPQHLRLSREGLGIAWIGNSGQNQMVEVSDEHANVNIMLEELIALLDRVQVLAYAEHDFMRQFAPNNGYDLEIIGRTVLGRVVSFIALWPTKQVLVLAETTYRPPKGTRNRWEGIYYFSPKRKKIKRFAEILAGAVPMREERRVAKFMDRFSEDQRRKIAQRVETPYVM